MATYVYSSCNPIIPGCYLYTDACLTTAASTGTYSDGTNCFTVTTGGYISSTGSCTTYTVNIFGRYYYTPADFAIGILYSEVNSTSCGNQDDFIDITCDFMRSYNVSYGDTVTIGCKDSSGNNVAFTYAITPATTCPTYSNDFCGCNGYTGSFPYTTYATETITSNLDIYVSFGIDSGSGNPITC